MFARLIQQAMVITRGKYRKASEWFAMKLQIKDRVATVDAEMFHNDM
ncbi:unnamed protein product [Acidithrix sp. C25]|nr:unnamed protein product [Acidithrix sp. C25]